MAGLLEMLGVSSGDPAKDNALNQGLLSFGLNLMSSKRGNLAGALGEAGLAGLGTANQGLLQARTQGIQDKQLKFQEQQQAFQTAQQQAAEDARKKQQAFFDQLPSPQMQAAEAALSGGGGPSPANAARMQPVDPMAQLMHGAAKAGAIPLPTYLQSLQKDDALIKASPGDVFFDKAGKQRFAAPAKPAELPSGVREYEYAKTQGYRGTYEDWDRASKRAGASSVNVPINMGQKGFDNTLKLRGDFRSEPIYKAHQEVQSAYAQIGAALKQASPAGDLAGATKIMKLLDPGSVVRESELGMAMAATGLMDRVQNYAATVLNGTKLTPSQRKDFQSLADKLYQESAKQYNGKRGEYQGIAERNGLGVMDVLGGESAVSQPGAVPTPGASADPLNLFGGRGGR